MDVNTVAIDVFIHALLRDNPQVEWTDAELTGIRQRIVHEHTIGIHGTMFGRHPMVILPAEVGSLTHIRHLNVGETNLTTLPDSIGHLTNLQYLYLNETHLTAVPDSIGHLTHLRHLDLRGTHLTAVPDSIGHLTHLEVLDLRGTHLTAVPDSIGHLTHLRFLLLSDTRLATLPRILTNLNHLLHLDLHSTLLHLPPEVSNNTSNPQDIFDYFFQPARPLNEAKVMVVGESRTGKTSLVKQLLNHDERTQPEYDTDTTEGILPHTWSFEHTGETYRVHVWDVGGHEVMHATHHFFMTKRTVYVLVLDAAHTHEHPKIHYWLEMIKNVDGDSPIVIVRNQADTGRAIFDEGRILDANPSVQQVSITSCTTGEGLDRLYSDLRYHILQRPHVHNPIPVTWHTVKDRCTQDIDTYIMYTHYTTWCEEAGIYYEYDQTRLLELLHDLGVVVWYQDPSHLSHTLIFNPSWIIRGIYGLLHGHPYSPQGILHASDLSTILDKKHYPHESHHVLLAMMERFEIGCVIDDPPLQAYLIPDLLPQKRPTTPSWTEGWDDSIHVLYHYPTGLPHRILGLLMIRLRTLLDLETVWHDGCILQNELSSRARIELKPHHHQLRVLVLGSPEMRQEMLTHIRYHMDMIHRLFPTLQVHEYVSLDGDGEHLVLYQDLLTIEQRGKDGENALDAITLLDTLSTAHMRRIRRRDTDIEQVLNGTVEIGDIQLSYQEMRELRTWYTTRIHLCDTQRPTRETGYREYYRRSERAYIAQKMQILEKIMQR